jgi:hypothetical protein
VIVNSPQSFEDELRRLKGVKIVGDTQSLSSVEFAITFVTQRLEVDRAARKLIEKSAGDATRWFAYPKGTSKTLQSEVKRDTGWDILRSAGFDTVRLVAIDADWSALRFRRKEHIGGPRRRLPGLANVSMDAIRNGNMDIKKGNSRVHGSDGASNRTANSILQAWQTI